MSSLGLPGVRQTLTLAEQVQWRATKVIWGLKHKTYKEELRAGSVKHEEGKAQGEFDSSLCLSNWDM